MQANPEEMKDILTGRCQEKLTEDIDKMKKQQQNVDETITQAKEQVSYILKYIIYIR